MAKLTPKQQQIVRLLAQGNSQKQIARTLNIAYGTVRKHTLAARQRTECQSTMEIVVRAMSESPP